MNKVSFNEYQNQMADLKKKFAQAQIENLNEILIYLKNAGINIVAGDEDLGYYINNFYYNEYEETIFSSLMEG